MVTEKKDIDYQQFAAMLIAQLQMQLQNVQIERGSFKKVNEKNLDGITFKYPNSPVSPTIYLNRQYQLYQEGVAIGQIIAGIMSQLEKARAEAPDVPVLNQETAKRNLYCAVVNANENKELLKDVPHERLEDLAVIPRFKVGENGSFLVKNEHCGSLQMTSEEIMDAAHKNTEQQGFQCQNMSEVLRGMMKEQGMSDEYITEMLEMQGESCPMYVMSNASKVDGAVALTSKNAMDAAYNKIKQDHPDMKDMYVLGSSRHELILLPDDTVSSVEDLKAIHKEVQSTELDRSDRLTNNIYRYNTESRKITIADTPVKEKTESAAMELAKTHARSH